MPRYATTNLNMTLTYFGIELLSQGGAFVADDLLPVVPVEKDDGKYIVYSGVEDVSDNKATLRGPKDKAAEIDWAYSDDAYSAEEHALRHLMTPRDIANAQKPIDLEQQAVNIITGKIRVGLEGRVKNLIMDTEKIPNGAVAAAWDAESGVKIEDDIDDAKEEVQVACGMAANTIVIPPHISVHAKKDPKIRDLVKHTDQSLLVNGDLPQTLFNLKVKIPGAIQNAANAGLAANLGRIWSDNYVWVGYVAQGPPSMWVNSHAYQFRSRLYGNQLINFFRYPDADNRGIWVEGRLLQDEKLVNAACGFILTGAHS